MPLTRPLPCLVVAIDWLEPLLFVDVKDVQRYRWSDYGFHLDIPVALGFYEKALQIGKVSV